MKKTLATLTMILLSWGAVSAQELLSTRNTSLVLDATKGKELKFLHYGSSMSTDEAAFLKEAGWKAEKAYPVYGLIGNEEAALSLTHADGNMTLKLVVDVAE